MTMISDTVKAAVDFDRYSINLLANTAGISKTTLHRFLRGKGSMRSETLEKLCDLLKLKLFREVNLADFADHVAEVFKENELDWWKDFESETWPDVLADAKSDADEVPDDEDEYREWIDEIYNDWKETAYVEWAAKTREELLIDEREAMETCEWILLNEGRDAQ